MTSQTEPVNLIKLQIKKVKKRKNHQSSPYDLFSAFEKLIDEAYSEQKSRMVQFTVCGRKSLPFDFFTEYIRKKYKHCVRKEDFNSNALTAHLSCNIYWLLSVLQTEIEYHCGKAKLVKRQKDYMKEYVSTQLSGFGPKFYCNCNISQSIIAELHPL